jgi:DNA gyrase subunit A
VPFEAEILLVTDAGTVIRMPVQDVNPTGRATQGVQVMRPGDGATVVGLAMVVDDEEDVADDLEATDGQGGSVKSSEPAADANDDDPSGT